MKKSTTALLAAIILTLTAPLAHAKHSSNYSVEILVNGKALTTYDARGTTYIEAKAKAEYAVRLTNHTGERIAIALSIDGLNSIDAKTTSAKRASKWVLAPWESITVDGWQTGATTARRFFFTTEETSYGAWLGKTTNLGVISAAVFREKRPPVKPYITRNHSKSEREEAPKQSARGSAAPEAKEKLEGCFDESDDLAATGIGREVDNPVRHVRFIAEKTPSAEIRIRYEYRPQLVRLGVLPQPFDRLDRREHAQGFTDFDFAPDPYRR